MVKKLVIGRRYHLTRLEEKAKQYQEKTATLEYLGSCGSLYLFRHPKGYKEAFHQKGLGIAYRLTPIRKAG